MDMLCEVCPGQGARRSILEIGLTYMGMAGKLRVCAICAGITDATGNGDYEAVHLEEIIHALQRKTERLEAEQRQQIPPQ